ncbi:hypothetical protein LBMAG53_02600 [Planctomycetota bacterium]|nr:hypothetical protein LBMAG53_02600 [Planctomycetota bacterium]
MPDLPLIANVDLLIVGGSAGGVAAALAAKAAGRSVLIVAPRPYLGDDLAAYLRFWCAAPPTTDLGRAIFPDGRQAPSPLHIKLTLEQACIAAGIDLLFNAFPAGVLRSDSGDLAGLVIADRNGRRAVRAAAVIDATHRAVAARQAGAAFAPWPGTPVEFRRVVVGAPALDLPGVRREDLGTLQVPLEKGPQAMAVVAYHRAESVADGSVAELQAADIRLRRSIWHHQQLVASEASWFLPPDPLAGAVPDHDGLPAAADLLSALEAVPGRLWVLGGCARLSRRAAAKLVDPAVLLAVGEDLGRRVAGLVRPAAIPIRAELPGSWRPAPGQHLRSAATGARPGETATTWIACPDESLPDVAAVDVLVCGGGTGGAPAATGAARSGASTLLIEHLHALGGVGTLGQITRYWYGNRVGYTRQLDERTVAMGPDPRYAQQGKQFDWFQSEWKQQAHLLQVSDAGGEVWFGASAVAVLIESAGTTPRIAGALVCHEYGCGVVTASAVVDASGNADLAAAAGAPTVTTGAEHVAVQGTGLPPIRPGIDYTNSDHTFVDDTDATDVTRAFVTAKRKFATAWDLGQLIDSRQRRQIVGEYALTPLDILCDRTFPDAICRATSNFDTHGFTIHPVFAVVPPTKAALWAWVPYRCLLPRGLDGLLVTGLGMSAHRDALPVVRMQPDVQNTGFAAGVAAALAVGAGRIVREVDLDEVQRRLVAVGSLPAEVIGMSDSFPLSSAAIAAAVGDLKNHLSVATCFAYPAAAHAGLIDALADPSRQEAAALILGLQGDSAAAPVLRQLIDASPWDEGWNFTGMHQFGRSQSRLDALLVALGLCGDTSDLPRLAERAGQLPADTAFSHLRAVAAAGTALHQRHPSAIAGHLLDQLLALPGLSGHARNRIADLQAEQSADINDNLERNRTLKELHLAVALVRCGDPSGRGRAVLEGYARDLRGHYARHARAVLAEVPVGARARMH